LGKDGIKIIEQYTKQARPNFGESWLDEIEKLKRDLDFIGGIDPEVTKEYKECRERFDFLNEQAKDLIKAASRLKKIIRELDSQIDNQFKKTFGKIGQEFEKYFKILFGGGKAKLVLQKQEIEAPESTTEESEESKETEPQIIGIDILATPPGKKLKNIEMLSGGEKALTALALICAIISCNAPPFVVLDEVDAALDEANSVKFANIIERLSHKTQFIVVTHNRATMQKANILYGVTMGKDGISRLLSLKLEEAVK
jgi:chromosome segregation protein